MDYSVHCDSNFYVYVLELVCGFLVLLWPIGLPLSLGVVLFRKRRLIELGDEDTLKMFQFIIADFKENRWYWEVSDLSISICALCVVWMIRF